MSEATAIEKPKFPRALALEVVRELLPYLQPSCGLLRVAGSLRRERAMVGDVELVFVPVLEAGPVEDLLLPPPMIAQTDRVFAELLKRGVIEKRQNVKGSEMWGEKNKLARHRATGVPIDFFATTDAAFWNYLVCRTGGARSNVEIANAARKKGWMWNPYDEGFSRPAGLGQEVHPVQSEREVFDFVGLPYLEPRARK